MEWYDRAKMIMRHKRITQRKIAEELEEEPGTVSRWLNGKRRALLTKDCCH